MFWMYMLRCSDGSYYVGRTTICQRASRRMSAASFVRATPSTDGPSLWCSRKTFRRAKRRSLWNGASRAGAGQRKRRSSIEIGQGLRCLRRAERTEHQKTEKR